MEKQIKETTGYFYSEDLKRIADALDEILRLVKADQEKMRKISEEPRPDLPEDVPFKGRL